MGGPVVRDGTTRLHSSGCHRSWQAGSSTFDPSGPSESLIADDLEAMLSLESNSSSIRDAQQLNGTGRSFLAPWPTDGVSSLANIQIHAT